MRQLRKLTNKEWKEIGEKYKNGGVYIYRGKRTLFWNGEKLRGDDEYLIYNNEERDSWEVIIILPGVEIIPEGTFGNCENVETVIMSDTVQRIEIFQSKKLNKLTIKNKLKKGMMMAVMTFKANAGFSFESQSRPGIILQAVGVAA